MHVRSLNFPVPQQNPIGKLQNWYSLDNPIYFVEQLNRRLHECVNEYKNAHVIDYDQITANFGKRYVQEDFVFISNHGSILGEFSAELAMSRLENPGTLSEIYGHVPQKYILAVFEEAIGLKRTIEQRDAVKLVIFDLDDTLWNGVLAEADHIDDSVTEGWPTGTP